MNEDYIKSESHWQAITGYFQKKGYFHKGKGYQTALPDWARKSGQHIRRFGRMVLATIKREGEKKMDVHNIKTGECLNEGFMYPQTYEVRLEKCGKKTRIGLECKFWGTDWVVNLHFEDVKKLFPEGKYYRGQGYVAFIDEEKADRVMDLIIRHSEDDQFVAKGELGLIDAYDSSMIAGLNEISSKGGDGK